MSKSINNARNGYVFYTVLTAWGRDKDEAISVVKKQHDLTDEEVKQMKKYIDEPSLLIKEVSE